jgi:hypothetical protein
MATSSAASSMATRRPRSSATSALPARTPSPSADSVQPGTTAQRWKPPGWAPTATSAHGPSGDRQAPHSAITTRPRATSVKRQK